MKKFVSVLLAALMLLSVCSLTAFAAGTQTGTVTVSIEDFGDRDYLLDYCDEEDMRYLTPFGTIVAATEVPIYEGDTVASALVRLFEMKGITYNAWGTTDLNGGFYLQNITFARDGETVENFGEGSITPDDEYMFYFSGWMVMLNNCYTSSGISDYLAEDGDVIRMRYTCSMGADIGNDWSNASAKITGINVDAAYGAVSPAFSADVKEYTLTVGENTESVKLSVDNEYYGAEVTYAVGDVTYKYLRAIPVTNGTVITVDSKYYTSDYNTGEKTLEDEDRITITVVKPEPQQTEPTEDPQNEGKKSFLDQLKDFIFSILAFFRNLFTRLGDFFKGLTK